MWHHFSRLLFAIRTLVAATTQDLEEEVEEEEEAEAKAEAEAKSAVFR
jgi:hypothetical protein